MIDIKSLAQKLLGEKSLAIITHIKPDGDTLGSALALKCALKKVNKTCDVFCFEQVSEKFFFIDEFKTVRNDFENVAKNYSAICCIDCADVTRLGDFYPIIEKHSNTYNIDHHISNNRYAVNNYVVEKASNCENIFYLIKEMGIKIDLNIANLLLTGVVTDTGCFKHKNVTSETLIVASELVKIGGDINNIYYNTFSKQTKQRAGLFGATMSKLRYFNNDRIAMATIRLTDIEKYNAKQDDTEGFVDFIMGIDSVEIGITILEIEKDKFKISFRSKGTDVNAVAGTFGGGGHILASGCRLSGDYEEVVDKLRYACSQHLID